MSTNEEKSQVFVGQALACLVLTLILICTWIAAKPKAKTTQAEEPVWQLQNLNFSG
jgi:hypothetical protein